MLGVMNGAVKSWCQRKSTSRSAKDKRHEEYIGAVWIRVNQYLTTKRLPDDREEATALVIRVSKRGCTDQLLLEETTHWGQGRWKDGDTRREALPVLERLGKHDFPVNNSATELVDAEDFVSEARKWVSADTWDWISRWSGLGGKEPTSYEKLAKADGVATGRVYERVKRGLETIRKRATLGGG